MSRNGFGDSRVPGKQLIEGKCFYLFFRCVAKALIALGDAQRFRYRKSNRALLVVYEQHTVKLEGGRVLVLF